MIIRASSEIEPIISEVLQLISKQNGVGKVSMSGSGATCFGIFENKSDCDLALKKIQEQRPECDCIHANKIYLDLVNT